MILTLKAPPQRRFADLTIGHVFLYRIPGCTPTAGCLYMKVSSTTGHRLESGVLATFAPADAIERVNILNIEVELTGISPSPCPNRSRWSLVN